MALDDYRRSQRGTITQPGSFVSSFERSNQALREAFARNPVIPNTAPGVRPQNDFDEAPGVPTPPSPSPSAVQSGDVNKTYGLPTGQPAAPATSPQLAQLDAINAPQRTPVVTPEATSPRGPVQAAVGAQTTAPTTQPTPPAPPPTQQPQQAFVSAAMGGQQNLPPQPLARTELDMIRAREQQDAQSRNDAMQRGINYASAWDAQRKAEGEARVANFRATNGADMILAGGTPEQKQAIIQQQQIANARLAGANANLVAATQPGPQRNYIQEAAQGAQLREQSIAGADARLNSQDARTTGALTRQGMEINQQTAQQKLEQEKRISDASAKLLAAKTTDEREFLQQSIITMLGKDPKDGFKVMPYTLPPTTNEFGQIVPGGQGVVYIEPGKPPQIIAGPGAPGAAAQPGAQQKPGEPAIGEVRVDKNGVRGKYLGNGQWGPA
jgi:hypothetical protein